MRIYFQLLSAFLACAALGSLSLVQAQPSGARGDDFIYRVMKNDTLIDLASRYTGQSGNWLRLQNLNQVIEPTLLPIGLELRIPFSLIPEQTAQARVVHHFGAARQNSQALVTGSTIDEGDVLTTQGNSFVTLEMPDGSLATMPPHTQLDFSRLRTFTGSELIDAIMELKQGSVESVVAPNQTGTGRYEIRTPVSITGVRGTNLRVHSSQQGSHTEVLEGSAQMGKEQANQLKLAANQGVGVSAQGQFLPVETLLAAPQLADEALKPSAGNLMFTPVQGAQAYEVRVAADAQGAQPVSTKIIEGPPAAYQAPGSGTWYVFVRAISQSGLKGSDARASFEGHAVLQSAYGVVVSAQTGQPVRLGY